jgi:diaminohydroxyphosphoribosylaminopyrimidine deaminase / 5-amino-6-(5-phosphoribosylamino)uracil reductase
MNPFDEPDSRWMYLALDQAKRGLGLTSPNPPVGAVVVAQGRVIGQGYHRRAGQPHAEIEAIADAQRNAPKLLSGATLYVTLEPCSTHGRTGACTVAIRTSGIRRVVWGATDPNPKHRGKAQALFSSYGIPTTIGVLEPECQELIRPFSKWVTTGKPYVIIKVGQSLDGRITRPGDEGTCITSDAARAHARRLRSRVDAILVGAGTVREDNPRLTLREGSLAEKEQPYRVILSRSCQLPEDSHVFNDEFKDRTWVLRDLNLPDVLRELGRREIVSVLVEGGSDVLGQFFQHGLVDEVYAYIAPRLCGSGCLPTVGAAGLPKSVNLTHVKILTIGDNVCINGRPDWSAENASTPRGNAGSMNRPSFDAPISQDVQVYTGVVPPAVSLEAKKSRAFDFKPNET